LCKNENDLLHCKPSLLKNKILTQEVSRLKNKLNQVEQHGRNYSIRINNLPIPDNIAEEPYLVRDFAFKTAVAPILRGAVDEGKLAGMPTAASTIELAHVLPGAPGKPRPIIMRFFNRNDRALVLRHRKQFAVKDNNGRYSYPIYEDLTRDTFQLMRKLSGDDRVEACWTVRGQIRYRCTGSTETKKVDNIFKDFQDHF